MRSNDSSPRTYEAYANELPEDRDYRVYEYLRRKNQRIEERIEEAESSSSLRIQRDREGRFYQAGF